MHPSIYYLLLFASETKVICENRRAALKCPKDNKLKVLSADFGRQDAITCPKRNTEKSDGTCSNDVTATLSAQCDGFQKCRIAANKGNFNRDQCEDILAVYLSINYKCQSELTQTIYMKFHSM